jgi:predicted nucleotidyltransferase
MNNILRDISGKIDPEIITILRSITDVANELGIPFFVVGAFARDVMFEHIHGIPTARATRDIDIGVEVASWEAFEVLTGTLVTREHFMATRQPYRFEAKPSLTLVDIVPYGAISDETMQISWPPDHERVMSMLGFEEAYRTALTVRLSKEPSLDVLVPSMAALTLLKIISWDDAYPRRSRDAIDLFFMLHNCSKAQDMQVKLYESYRHLLEQESFDPDLAAVRLLGQEMSQIGSMETRHAVQDILARASDENGKLRLISDMTRGVSLQNRQFEHALQLLKKLLQGMQDQDAE